MSNGFCFSILSVCKILAAPVILIDQGQFFFSWDWDYVIASRFRSIIRKKEYFSRYTLFFGGIFFFFWGGGFSK